MESRQIQPESLFPAIAAQIRGALSTFHLAAAQAVPPEARERDPELESCPAAAERMA